MAEDQSVSQDTSTVNSGGDTPAQSSSDNVSGDTDVSEVVAEAKPEDATESEDSVNSEQSDRAQSRQQVLANKLKDKGVEVDSLRSELDAYKEEQRKPTGPDALSDYGKAPPQGDVELTWDDYNKDVMSRADQLVRLRLSEYSKSQVRLSRFEEGVRSVESQYPELNPDSESYDQTLAKNTTALFKSASDKNPDLDVSQFMSSVMDIRSGGEQQGRSTASKTMADQEATGAVTPSGESTTRVSNEEALIKKMKSGEITAAEFEKLSK